MKKNSVLGEKFIELIDIIARLRAPDGCPWDQKQTVRSFTPYLIEESHELTEALHGEDPAQVREELGDLLFQVGFLNQLFQEQGHFTLVDVLQGIIDKMIRRHPHVFADAQFTSYDEMRKNWARVKEEEKKAKKSDSNELDIPRSLPALIRSQRVAARVGRGGFDLPDMDLLAATLRQSQEALIFPMLHADKIEFGRRLGAHLFLLSMLAGKFDLGAEECLHESTNGFIERFKEMEHYLNAKNQKLEQLDIITLLGYWQRISCSQNDDGKA